MGAGQEGEGMLLAEVERVISAFRHAGIDAWVEGGWGVDALIGRQTRPHRDLDLDIDVDAEAAALEVLSTLGYAVETDWRPTRIEMIAAGRGWVDVHPLQFGVSGDAVQAAPDGSFWNFPRRYFTRGRIGDVHVGCYTIEAQRYFHSGYDLRQLDRLDMAALDALEEGMGHAERH